MDKTEMLTEMKRLAGVNDTSLDEVFSFIIEDTVNNVLAYCRLEVLPYQLCGLIPQMALSTYRTLVKSGGIAAITEGDRRIEYHIGDVLSDYRERLSAFINRRARLPSEVETNE